MMKISQKGCGSCSCSPSPNLEGIQEERTRILNEINKLEEQSHKTKTPIYQETLFKRIRAILEGPVFPPRQFRDVSNGE